jgi:MFS superfamily sulfate permease-like transporter
MSEGAPSTTQPESTGLLGLLKSPRADLVAGSVVFLVALPLCLGIAVASGAPPLAGIVAGIVGGLVIPLISRAELSVSGPAAGLTAIVLTGISTLGSWSAFAAAVFLAGLFQMLFGALRAGAFASIVPASVIKGMLSAIGVILMIKQVNVVLGVPDVMIDVDYLLLSADRFSNWADVVRVTEPGSIIIAGVSVAIILAWPKAPLARVKWLSSSLVVVVVGSSAPCSRGCSQRPRASPCPPTSSSGCRASSSPASSSPTSARCAAARRGRSHSRSPSSRPSRRS